MHLSQDCSLYFNAAFSDSVLYKCYLIISLATSYSTLLLFHLLSCCLISLYSYFIFSLVTYLPLYCYLILPLATSSCTLLLSCLLFCYFIIHSIVIYLSCYLIFHSTVICLSLVASSSAKLLSHLLS